MTTRTTTQSVTERVRAKVLDGELSPGSRLQERQLAAALGVSRTPVRDALQVLASEGLLDYSPHSGYIVRRFGLSEVLDSFDVRIALEGMASRKLAEIGPSPETIELLTENVRRSLEVVDVEQWTSNSRTRWLELNLEFHDTILNAVGNRYLIRGVQDARGIPRIYDHFLRSYAGYDELAQRYTHDQVRQAVSDHRRLLEAITESQPDRAEFLMREHIFVNREQLRRHIELRPGADSAQA
ncbi:MAG TPA: GntR family transcriptional regulator [Pseudonocardiaceae bacterium]